MAVLQSTNTRLLPGLSDISSPELFFPSYVSTCLKNRLVSSAELGSCDTTGAPPHHTKPRSRSLVSNSDNTLNTRQPINRVTMPQERPVLGVQSTPLNPSSDTFINAPSHLSAETVLTPSHLFAEMVLGASHLLAETVFSASHLFVETVFSVSHLFMETVFSVSHLFMETVFSMSHLFTEMVLSASPLFAETYQ
ncbi:hypothetical protein BS47DRAFT_1398752 [Hydnum rufescens UP504]|uniref:Uncharacterized protein n=1 Tax=Hydnum rufescens UP504 TaxID=1448309 RepID=A0A9P6DR67_9AGAM|nr:hypothetical protein BS47DRAFT_1398752 [Hydnum rufescens UP504]